MLEILAATVNEGKLGEIAKMGRHSVISSFRASVSNIPPFLSTFPWAEECRRVASRVLD